MARTFFVGGNFKLNGSKQSIKEIVERLNTASIPENVEVVICPPATYLDYSVSLVKKPQVTVGAQNAYLKASGAFTGYLKSQLAVALFSAFCCQGQCYLELPLLAFSSNPLAQCMMEC